MKKNTLWTRFRRLFTAKANAALDRAEDPAETADQFIREYSEVNVVLSAQEPGRTVRVFPTTRVPVTVGSAAATSPGTSTGRDSTVTGAAPSATAVTRMASSVPASSAEIVSSSLTAPGNGTPSRSQVNARVTSGSHPSRSARSTDPTEGAPRTRTSPAAISSRPAGAAGSVGAGIGSSSPRRRTSISVRSALDGWTGTASWGAVESSPVAGSARSIVGAETASNAGFV